LVYFCWIRDKKCKLSLKVVLFYFDEFSPSIPEFGIQLLLLIAPSLVIFF
jgi:hypothetical protein